MVDNLTRALGGLAMLLLLCGTVTAESVPLALNLLSSVTPIAIADHALPAELNGYQLYTTEFVKGNTRWYRLRLGVFSDNKAAKAAMARLRAQYPSAWIDRASVGEISAAGLPAAEVKVPEAQRPPEPFPAVAPVAVAGPPSGEGLSINLLSSLTPIDLAGYAVPPQLAGYRYYVTEFDKDGRRWYRLRLGLFANRSEAAAALAQLRADYPSAWIDGTAAAGEAPEVVRTARPLPAPVEAPAIKSLTLDATRSKPVQKLASRSDTRSDGIDPEQRYVINLMASTKPLNPSDAEALVAALPGLRLYATESERRGDRWYFLRAGFFASRGDAEALLPQVQQTYPDARVMKITRYELAQATGGESVTAVDKLPAARSGSRSAVLESARLALIQGNYDQAVLLYQQAIDEGDADTAREAQELLGVAQERRGDMAAAHKEYERFLGLYPEGEDAERVRQRLVALETAHAELKAGLRTAKKRSAPSQYMLYGSFSAIYRQDTDVTDAEGAELSRSALTSYFDVTGRVRSGDYDTRLRFTGSHRKDFMDNGPGDENRLSTFYLDVLNKEQDWSVRFGRQSSSSGGVLGRFDGVFAGMRLTPQLKLNAVAGYPVQTSADTAVNDRANFVGVSADISGLAESWDFQLYGIQQRADGYLDRNAVGGEARYFQPDRSFFGLVDYDAHYKKLNTMMLLGTWSVTEATSLNLLYDRRMSPTLSTSNALQGQAVSTLDALAQIYTTEQIEQLALDRTAESQTIMAGVAHTLSERYQITADITTTEVGATPESGGVMATPSSGGEYYVSAQLIGRNLIWQEDITILGLRLGQGQTVDTAAMFVNSRVNTGHWQFNPRIQLEYRDDKSNDFNYWMLKPSLVTNYRRWQQHSLEGEVGAALTSRKEVPQNYYFSLGYRWDFN